MESNTWHKRWRHGLVGIHDYAVRIPKLVFCLVRAATIVGSFFRLGEKLRVEVKRIFQSENGLGQFDCTITIDDEQVATAALTVFEPPTGKNFFDGSENV